jgi:hypothetical protein
MTDHERKLLILVAEMVFDLFVSKNIEEHVKPEMSFEESRAVAIARIRPVMERMKELETEIEFYDLDRFEGGGGLGTLF